MQAHLGGRQEGTFSLDGSFSALGDQPFADACQCKEGYLANMNPQKLALHAPLLHDAALLAVLLQALPECFQQALAPVAGRK